MKPSESLTNLILNYPTAGVDVAPFWSSAAIVLCMIAALAFVILFPFACMYVSYPEEGWFAKACAALLGLFVLTGTTGIASAMVMRGHMIEAYDAFRTEPYCERIAALRGEAGVSQGRFDAALDKCQGVAVGRFAIR